MLRATPFHRENYSHLIVSVIHQFYQRCNERFKGQLLFSVPYNVFLMALLQIWLLAMLPKSAMR